MRKKIIVIPPGGVNALVGEKIWDLLRSDEFAKLRGGFHKDLTPDEIAYLRKGFEPFVVLTDSPMGRYFVNEDEEISVQMMLQAAYELTKYAVAG